VDSGIGQKFFLTANPVAMKNIILGLPNFLQEAHMVDPNGLIPLALFINAIARLLEALRKWRR
jgi:hypothetical protein